MVQPLSQGTKAPDFRLPDHDGKEVTLKQFRGQRVLLYFYPKAMTPGCTVQACGLRDVNQELEEAGVIVLGVSPDAPSKLKKFAEKEKLPFRLIADESHELADSFGVWGPKKFMGRTFDGIHRISFLIDAKGKIEHVLDDFSTKNHHQVVLDYVHAHS